MSATEKSSGQNYFTVFGGELSTIRKEIRIRHYLKISKIHTRHWDLGCIWERWRLWLKSLQSSSLLFLKSCSDHGMSSMTEKKARLYVHPQQKAKRCKRISFFLKENPWTSYLTSVPGNIVKQYLILNSKQREVPSSQSFTMILWNVGQFFNGNLDINTFICLNAHMTMFKAKEQTPLLTLCRSTSSVPPWCFWKTPLRSVVCRWSSDAAIRFADYLLTTGNNN